MEITRIERGSCLELGIEGRLDGYWAQHLAATVGDAMRQGRHAVRLNLAKTAYISSAGIGVLVDLYKQFQAVSGSFVVAEPSRNVLGILKMVGLETMLVGEDAVERAQTSTVELLKIGDAVFEIHNVARTRPLICRLMGHPERLAAGGFQAEDCTGVDVGDDRVILGLGAFGEGFDGCRERFGEFLAVCGAAACQPTDGTNFPDYMVGAGDFVPHLTALYGLSCEGTFGKLVRFESAEPLPFRTIAAACLEIARAETAGVVVLAESAGLMGAMLKRPPVTAGKLFAYPEIREWLSFSPERCFPHALALIAGVATQASPDELRPFVRPMGGGLSGHFHAAAFGYRPLQKGPIEMKTTIRNLLEGGGLQGVLHLLADDREHGGGESELQRGACWVSPVKEVVR